MLRATILSRWTVFSKVGRVWFVLVMLRLQNHERRFRKRSQFELPLSPYVAPLRSWYLMHHDFLHTQDRTNRGNVWKSFGTSRRWWINHVLVVFRPIPTGDTPLWSRNIKDVTSNPKSFSHQIQKATVARQCESRRTLQILPNTDPCRNGTRCSGNVAQQGRNTRRQLKVYSKYGTHGLLLYLSAITSCGCSCMSVGRMSNESPRTAIVSHIWQTSRSTS